MNDNSYFQQKENWQARWIWTEDNSVKNDWCCFRRQFKVNQLQKQAELSIAVDSKYFLWINGQLIVYEGGLNRGPKPGAGYYDVLDISPYLCEGINTLAILAWYWGNEGRNNIDSGAAGLLVQIDLDEKAFISDDTWHVCRHSAYEETKDPLPAYLYGGHNIGFNAEKDMPDWYQPAFDVSSWEQAVIKGKAGCSPWGELYKRPLPLLRFAGLKPFTEFQSQISHGQQIITAKLPHGMHCAPAMEVESPEAGLMIDIRSDRYQVNGGPGDNTHTYRGHRVLYKTRQGLQRFEALNWVFAEQIIYSLPEKVNVRQLWYRPSGYDTDIAGAFFCDDTFLNRLCEKAALTLTCCMRDNYMDCPDRERGQWIGDVSSQLPQAFYVLDRKADQLSRKAIYDFISFRQGAVLKGNVPGVHCAELPSQSLNAISTKGMILTYYAYTGDLSIIQDSLPAVLDYLDLWEIEENGHLLARSGDWAWHDHGAQIDAEVLEHVWYYMALDAAHQMCGLTECFEPIDNLDFKRQKIKAYVNQNFWKPDGYRSSDYLDDRANGLAVLAGLAEKEKWPVLLKVLQTVYEATPYMEGYILEALFQMGYTYEALERMKKRYKHIVEHESTTLWEDFEVLGTMNHAWTGAPLALLARYAAGIDTDTPGYENYHVYPDLLTFQKIEARVPTSYGLISAQIYRTEVAFNLRLQSPEGTSALVGVPKKPFYHLEDSRTDNKKKISQKDAIAVQYDGQTSGLTGKKDEPVFIHETQAFYVYKAPAGKWIFSVVADPAG